MATTTMKKAIRYIDDTHARVTKAFSAPRNLISGGNIRLSSLMRR